jgi:hypothetical protein
MRVFSHSVEHEGFLTFCSKGPPVSAGASDWVVVVLVVSSMSAAGLATTPSRARSLAQLG